MAAAAEGAPEGPPPDYEYAVTHPQEEAALPDYRVAVNLPSYQQAVLDKGQRNCVKLITIDISKVNNCQ